MEKNVGKSCSTCGQVFDPSIAFCPTDGTKLSSELVTASSHELIQVTSRHLIKKPDTTRVSSPQIVMDKSRLDDAPNESFGNGSRTRTDDEVERNAEVERNSEVERNPEVERNAGADSTPVRQSSRSKKFLDSGPLDLTGDELRDTRSHIVPTLIGTTLDNQYEIQSVIGKGGMSFVYKATHLLMRKTVAIKTLLPHLTLQATSLQRFQQEAQAASNLKHPNIIAVHNFGTTPDGEPYLVMDYVEGSSIADELDTYGFVQVDRAVDIFIQVADALAHAHQRGIIHRDLKPSNILLLEKDGHKDHVNIVDFGIAKMLPQDGVEAISLTQTGEVFGSPLYMSPEQCKGEKLDARSDIYSMGCLMYETLTGRAATSGDNTMEVLYNHIHEVPAPMKAPLTYIPPQMERIVLKTLAKDPAQRYQSMGQLRDELKSFSVQRKTNFLSKLTSSWQVFWLRRKPRTKRDKIIVATAISGFACAVFFAYQIAALYWAAADSPESKAPIVWDEDREAHKPIKEAMENANARIYVLTHTRTAASRDADGSDRAQLVNELAAGGEFLTNRHLWKSALAIYELAYKYSLKYNDYLALRTMSLRMAMADCYINMQQYEEGARIVDEMKRKMGAVAQRDFVDRSILEAKLGNIFYLEGKWQPALQNFASAYQVWTEKHEASSLFTFYSLPTDLTTNYDFTLLISRMATAYQRIYQESVANGSPDLTALKNSIRFYKLAGEQWGHLVGDHESNRNGTVAMANYVYLDHILDKNADLDAEYKQVAQRSKEFGTDSAYEGIILLNYAEYLMDKGRLIDAATNKINGWRIFAQISKAGVAAGNTKSESSGESAPVVGK